jgi:type IV pilus assembly protein PilC
MAVFEYKARNEFGEEIHGKYEGVSSISDLREELTKIGYTLLNAKKSKRFNIDLSSISRDEIVTFAFKLAGMISAGLSVIQSLDTIEEQTENKKLKAIISDIRQNVEAGSSLKEAFESHRNVFSDFFIGMLEAGESSGKLAEVLKISAEHLEKQSELRKKVKSAFTYPTVVGIMCVIVISAIMMFIIPVFSELYAKLNVQLPRPTQILIDISEFIKYRWFLIPPVIIGGIFGIKYLLKNPYFRMKWDSFKLNMPVLGKLNRMLAVSRYIRTFAMLFSTGVSIVRALQISDKVANNTTITNITEELEESIESGDTISDSLSRYDLFPSIIIQLAASGEQAGQLPEMLNKGVDFIDRDIDRTIRQMLDRLEPIITAAMGIIVGAILMGVYLPMFDYMSHLK